ncbi:guanylate cyclase [Variovorax sp. KK3]|uniref:guanylate cyclase n=1 Tax=Variovorax sp. KK3 TaxID=1855728 RepID=UPI0015C301C2|nr:guanylate cyclase [Variovorax sp. KK3]
MSAADPHADVESLRRVLASGGAVALVSALNARVPHRFTAFYRLRHDVLASICFHDKLGELDASSLADVPLKDSFCQFALRDGSFETQDASLDQRLDGHAYQSVVLSYHGVPVVDATGEVAGTLCHLDYVRQQLPRTEFDLLRAVALLLPLHLDDRSASGASCQELA